jgi:hypothetical protein
MYAGKEIYKYRNACTCAYLSSASIQTYALALLARIQTCPCARVFGGKGEGEGEGEACDVGQGAGEEERESEDRGKFY